jgi:MFS family permease
MSGEGAVAQEGVAGRRTFERVPMLAPLGGRDFRLVWAGEGVSLFGDQFHLVALAALVLAMTGSGLALGAILLAASIPRGLFLLIGGALSDRIRPRDLALASNVVRAAVTTLIAGLVLGARVELWQLAAAGVVFGTVDAVFLPAINTLIPRLVPVDRLAAANALMLGTAQLMGTVGPAVAGFAVALVGPGAAFALDAASFAVAALALWLVRGGTTATLVDATEPAPAQAAPAATELIEDPRLESSAIELPGEGGQAGPSILGSIVSGTRTVLGEPVMRSIVIISTAANLAFTGPSVVGLPWLVLVHFDAGPVALGLVFAAFGAGSLVGVVAAGSLGRPRRLGFVVLTLVLLMGLGLAAVGLAPSVPVLALVSAVTGAISGYVNVVVIAWAQARADPAMLGRTMSFLMLGGVIAAPLSLVIASAVVDTYATELFVLAGALVVMTGLYGLATGVAKRMT